MKINLPKINNIIRFSDSYFEKIIKIDKGICHTFCCFSEKCLHEFKFYDSFIKNHCLKYENKSS